MKDVMSNEGSNEETHQSGKDLNTATTRQKAPSTLQLPPQKVEGWSKHNQSMIPLHAGRVELYKVQSVDIYDGGEIHDFFTRRRKPRRRGPGACTSMRPNELQGI
jgi:hypothetical protein